MLFKAPTQTPHFQTLLDDMPTVDLARIAKHLAVSSATLKRWAKTGNAPRMAHLALFWESRWGLSLLDCDIWNRETLRLQTIRGLQENNAALKRQIAHLVATGNFGAANDPLFVDGVAPTNGQNKHRHDISLDFHQDAQLPQLVAVQSSERPCHAVTT